MTLLLAWFLASVQSPVTGTSACKPQLTKALSMQISRVRTSTNRDSRIDNLVRLSLYWDSVCPQQRYNASSRSVREISRLLRSPPARTLVSKMLFDVGPG